MLGWLFATTEFPMATTVPPSVDISIVIVSAIIAVTITTVITIAITTIITTTTTTTTVVITISSIGMECLALNCASLGIQKRTLHWSELHCATNSSRYELFAAQITLNLKPMSGQKLFVSHSGWWNWEFGYGGSKWNSLKKSLVWFVGWVVPIQPKDWIFFKEKKKEKKKKEMKNK